MNEMGLNESLAPGAAENTATTFPYAEEFRMKIKFSGSVWPAIILFGLCTNLVNIVVFLKAGVKDNVTTLLITLSMSDFTFLTLIIPTMCMFVTIAHAPDHHWTFDRNFVYHLFYWPAFTAYDLSAFISVSLGVMRCACVAMPLKFKLVFTKSRTVKWVLFLVVLVVALRLTVLTIFRVAYRTDRTTNTSIPYVAMVNRAAMSRINDVMNRGFVIWINYTTMVTCVGVLSYKLNQESRIRQTFKTAKLQTSDEAPEKTSSQGLSTKDLQVVRSVVLVCTIFIFSQLPFLVVSTTRLISSDFTYDSKWFALFSIISQSSLTLSYLNASVNIFVYYNYNSKYRAVFLSMLPFRSNKKTQKDINSH